MGFLESGRPLEWEDTDEYYKILKYVREQGVIQFLTVFNKVKNRSNDQLKWGDEIEYHIFSRDEESKQVRIECIAKEMIEQLENEELSLSKEKLHQTWHPEWGAWMIEATPAGPYGRSAQDLLSLEESLRNRRARIQSHLGETQGLCSLPAWPRMGKSGFVSGFESLEGKVANSSFLPDQVINPHPRFGALVGNIRKRKGRNVEIRVPVYLDDKTDRKGIIAENKQNGDRVKARGNDKADVYMDAMGFGMGCCCLQVTFQASDVPESRYLYDQLAVLCPIFLSLSAGTPILKGLLTATDVRWSTISQSVDCRTPVELGHKPISSKQRGSMRIQKSRYASVSQYISESALLQDNLEAYNDLNAEIDEPTFKKLVESGVDETLARHIAHLYIRDPLVIFEDRLHFENQASLEHFENIQSTNWQTMRWKPPPIEHDDIGWRVEFRPMESQLTDFENAAYITSVVLISRVILFFNLNLYVPLSKVDENMERAHDMDSLLKRKFWMRKSITPLEQQCDDNDVERSEEYIELTVAHILNGHGDEFSGLFPLIYAYLDIIDCDEETYLVLDRYLRFLSDRATGKVKTLARWMRDFVDSHPEYKKDSVISPKIEYDLVTKCERISNGLDQEPSLLGENQIKPIKLEAKRQDTDQLQGQRLRGASFSKRFTELKTSKKELECAVIRELVEKYKVENKNFIVTEKKGFSGTKSFLGF